jgi:hypothetical protein
MKNENRIQWIKIAIFVTVAVIAWAAYVEFEQLFIQQTNLIIESCGVVK